MLYKSKLQFFLAGLALLFLSFTNPLSAQTEFHAVLSSSNEVTPRQTMASGMITASLDGNELTVTGSFEGLSSDLNTDIAGGAHIHSGMAGENGGVAFGLTVNADADMRGGSFEAGDNTFALSDEQVETLMNHGFYVNIHSQNYAAGELRGQLMPDADAYFRANLSGSNEAPAVKTTGYGSVVMAVHGDSMFVSGAFDDLSADVATDIAGGAHIHGAMAGSNGNVSIPLNLTLHQDNRGGMFQASENRFELTAEQKAMLMNREFYVNIHSEAYSAGELRGQAVEQSSVTFVANLSGSAEVGEEVNSEGSGSVLVELQGDSLFASGSFSGMSSAYNTDIAGGGHLHLALDGMNGGVQIPLSVQLGENDTSGVFHFSENRAELTMDQKTALLDRKMYVNLHSENYANGELRAQVLGEAKAYFRTTLAGENEVNPVDSDGYGGVSIEMRDSTIVLSGAFAGLSSALNVDIAGGAHLHNAGAEANGDVAVVINATAGANDTTGTFEVGNNMYTLTDEQATLLLNEEMYVNIHSNNFGAGELRGQLVFAPNHYPDSSMITSPADGAELTLEGDVTTAFAAEWEEATDPDGNDLVYIWQLSTDAEFSNKVVNVNTGSEARFETTFGFVDTLLADLGVEAGGEATVYHRVVTSDGSERVASEGKSVVLTRGTLTSIDEPTQSELPAEITLKQNYPNPFNPTTEISFSLNKNVDANIAVFNMLGQKVATVADRNFAAGNHTVTFNASDLSSGVYFYQLKAGEVTQMRKMTLLK